MRVTHPFLWLCLLAINVLLSGIMWSPEAKFETRLVAFLLGVGFIGAVVFSISRLEEMDEESWRRGIFP